MWKPLSALPGYLGAKRRLLKDIFRAMPQGTGNQTLVDPFMGGGAVSLFAKGQGYRVMANDIAVRSYIIGRALIQNNQTKIEEEDLALLFKLPAENSDYIERKYSPKVFTTVQARFLDGALQNVWGLPEGDKKYLLLLLLVKHILAVRNFGKFTHTKDTQELEARRFEYPLRSASHARANLNMIHHPLPKLREYAQTINAAVFTNGNQNYMQRGDAAEFLKDRTGSVAYFDPPYADTSAYEDEYKVLDDILHAGKQAPEMAANPWSSSETARQEFRKLFAAASGFEHLVVSMGQTRSETGITPDELRAIMEETRPAEVKILNHRWSVSNAGGKQTKGENIEYLIVSK